MCCVSFLDVFGAYLIVPEYGCRDTGFALSADGASNTTHVGEQFTRCDGSPAPLFQHHCISHRTMLVMGTVLTSLNPILAEAKKLVASIKKSAKRTFLYAALSYCQ